MSSIAAADVVAAAESQVPPTETVEQTVPSSEAAEQTLSKKKKKRKPKNLRAQNQGKPVVTLVVDTNPFVKGLKLETLATKFVTVPEVVHELRSRASKDRFHELDIKHGVELINPDAESMQIVCNFAKKTGDFASLAIADLKVIALAFMLEKKENGMRRLRTEPVGNNPNISDRKLLESAEIAGGAQEDSDCEDLPEEDVTPEDVPVDIQQSMAALTVTSDEPEQSVAPSASIEATAEAEEVVEEAADEVCQPIDEVALDSSEPSMILQSVSNDDEFEVGSDEEFSDNESVNQNDDDDEGWEIAGPKPKKQQQVQDNFFKGDWITPQNVKQKQAVSAMGMKEAQGSNSTRTVTKVACVTSDFAMQNVMLKMGISLVTPDGVAITRLSTWVLRCHACFHLTGDMTKQFCPSCGYPTLKRCSVTTGTNGRLQVHLKANYKYNLRGTVFSIPKATGGQHSKRDIITREDDKVYMRAMNYRKAMDAKSNAGLSGANSLFDPDFMPGLLQAGYSTSNKGYGIATDSRGMPMVGRNCKNPNTVRKTGNRKNKKRYE
ncbi:20S-pre-rRNA D-site endonuclease nob1 [Coemansia sp. RSA 922]|nr:20S-pre-rRNA D-site endonuclease nob1 [Coemansia sp. S680]KAJ2109095.1 20S-pre-rRNA D-site endonuclease nob1 [Coemansia sp. RSA 922]